MSRPLLITDCDEVLLHMVRHFGEWLDEAHDIDFRPQGGAFETALTRRDSGTIVPSNEVWPLLDGFFRTEMDRQTLVPGAGEALEEIRLGHGIYQLTTNHPAKVAANETPAFCPAIAARKRRERTTCAI